MMPGSPLRHALSTILVKTSRASSSPAGCLVLGSTSLKVLLCCTACINSSVMPTDILKLVISALSFLQSMKFRISGWSIRRMPIFAPRRVPPCLTASVAMLKTRIKLIGPLATPPVVRTVDPDGRSREKEKPVPPPDL